ncbi:MAG: peptide chain release factor 1, partial [Candidatus Brockarchaeota archaeon]|nr:peptide chain release factor 1 [Candidatus Brockarchaeota archaeon]
FVQGDYLNYQLKSKIAAVVDTSYMEEQGVKEALEKAAPKMERIELLEEKKAVQRFLAEIGKDSGLAVYGEEEVKQALQAHKVSRLLISEDLSKLRVVVECSSCGYSYETAEEEEKIELFLSKIKSETCPKCKMTSLTGTIVGSVLEEFLELAEKAGADVDFISSKSEEGRMLLKGFGGIAAILKV